MNGVNRDSHSRVEQDIDESEQLTSEEMSDFLSQIEEFTPTIPDSVAAHYLSKSGVDTTDGRIVRILALAAQKFMSDIINDALQTSKLKGSSQQSRSSKAKEKKYVLTLDDLAPALSEYGINVKKPPYYT
ncbi:transcription initiation factor TFIID subunit 10-like [Styela clava]|uniref:transcription initiation factor TFIID subunit 10-like n=1 Tax=Styela clava TaxID=7725 RepID=UPI00193A129F|nr:transcription initiation factor TFIID subunit 10-like [Styela clava]